MYEESQKDLENALKKNPYDSIVLYRQGLNYYTSKKYKKCIKSLK
jgi:hypothetical protein